MFNKTIVALTKITAVRAELIAERGETPFEHEQVSFISELSYWPSEITLISSHTLCDDVNESFP